MKPKWPVVLVLGAAVVASFAVGSWWLANRGLPAEKNDSAAPPPPAASPPGYVGAPSTPSPANPPVKTDEIRIALPAESPPVVTPAAHATEIRTVENDRIWRNVHVRRGGEWVNLTRFTRPQEIHGADVSLDGAYVYVWHDEYPPRQISIYETATGRRLCNFVPGAGGSLDWTPGNHILHRWGAGTNTAIYSLYDLKGETLCGGLYTGLDVSPGVRFLVVCRSLTVVEEELKVVDLLTAKGIYQSDYLPPRTYISAYKWLSETEWEFECRDEKDDLVRKARLIIESPAPPAPKG